MEDIETERFRQRIRERLDACGLTARGASLAVGGSPDLLRGVLRGANNSLRGDYLVKLAKLLKVSESWLMTGADAPDADPPARHGVRFGGIVEAGAFRPVNDLSQDGELRQIAIAPDPRYPADAQFAFEVVGDSMTEAKIFEGMHILAVEIHAWEKLHGDPGDGKLVIVARNRNGEPERELTVKRLRIFRDRLELRPESRNPAHTPLVFPNPPRNDDRLEAQIIAVVISATWLFEGQGYESS